MEIFAVAFIVWVVIKVYKSNSDAGQKLRTQVAAQLSKGARPEVMRPPPEGPTTYEGRAVSVTLGHTQAGENITQITLELGDAVPRGLELDATALLTDAYGPTRSEWDTSGLSLEAALAFYGPDALAIRTLVEEPEMQAALRQVMGRTGDCTLKDARLTLTVTGRVTKRSVLDIYLEWLSDSAKTLETAVATAKTRTGLRTGAGQLPAKASATVGTIQPAPPLLPRASAPPRPIASPTRPPPTPVFKEPLPRPSPPRTPPAPTGDAAPGARPKKRPLPSAAPHTPPSITARLNERRATSGPQAPKEILITPKTPPPRPTPSPKAQAPRSPSHYGSSSPHVPDAVPRGEDIERVGWGSSRSLASSTNAQTGAARTLTPGQGVDAAALAERLAPLRDWKMSTRDRDAAVRSLGTLSVHMNIKEIGPSHGLTSASPYLKGQTVVGRVGAQEIAVRFREEDPRLRGLKRGDDLQITAPAAAWDTLYDRLVLESASTAG